MASSIPDYAGNPLGCAILDALGILKEISVQKIVVVLECDHVPTFYLKTIEPSYGREKSIGKAIWEDLGRNDMPMRVHEVADVSVGADLTVQATEHGGES